MVVASPLAGARSQHGSAKLAAIGAKLKAEGNGVMRRKVAATLRAEAKPLAGKTADAARAKLPKRGGLNELVARRHVTISVLMGPSTAGVRLRKRKDSASYQTNRGYIYHPSQTAIREGLPRTDPDYWEKQELPGAAGWWDTTLTREARAVTPAMLALINVTAREIGL